MRNLKAVVTPFMNGFNRTRFNVGIADADTGEVLKYRFNLNSYGTKRTADKHAADLQENLDKKLVGNKYR